MSRRHLPCLSEKPVHNAPHALSAPHMSVYNACSGRPCVLSATHICLVSLETLASHETGTCLAGTSHARLKSPCTTPPVPGRHLTCLSEMPVVDDLASCQLNTYVSLAPHMFLQSLQSPWALGLRAKSPLIHKHSG